MNGSAFILKILAKEKKSCEFKERQRLQADKTNKYIAKKLNELGSVPRHTGDHHIAALLLHTAQQTPQKAGTDTARRMIFRS